VRVNIIWIAFSMLFGALLINLYRGHTREIPNRNGRLFEFALRQLAIYSPRPSYPTESARRHAQGVAVAAITLAADGTVQRVYMLEAPDQLIADSVVHTVAQWRFQEPLPDQLKQLVAEGKAPPTLKTMPFDGRLTFYFRLTNGSEPTVSNPDEIEGWRSVDLATRFTSDTERTNPLGQRAPVEK
jgi:TonB family protein